MGTLASTKGFLLSLAVVVIALLSNTIYDYGNIRYIIVIIMLVMCMIFRERINIFKVMRKGSKDET